MVGGPASHALHAPLDERYILDLQSGGTHEPQLEIVTRRRRERRAAMHVGAALTETANGQLFDAIANFGGTRGQLPGGHPLWNGIDELGFARGRAPGGEKIGAALRFDVVTELFLIVQGWIERHRQQTPGRANSRGFEPRQVEVADAGSTRHQEGQIDDHFVICLIRLRRTNRGPT